MNIKIIDNTCWRCGKYANTTHHGIPQFLKPERNVEIPLCDKCHGDVNRNDVAGMYAHIFKLTKTIEQLRNVAFNLGGRIEVYLKRKKNGTDVKNEQKIQPKMQRM